jgi:UDP-glucose 4-epimerase
MMKTTLIFGGAGFVGLNIAEALLTAGRKVVSFDRRPPLASAQKHFASLPGAFSHLVGDIRDAAAVEAAFACEPDTVVYGAALTPGSVREAADPLAVMEVNLTGFVRVLEFAHKHNVARTVNLSSAGAYGAAAFRPGTLDETDAVDPRSLYSVTKFASERAATRLAELWKMDFRSVRLSAVFGPWEHDSGVRDTLSPPYQVARMALGGEAIVLARPTARDWVYGPDVAAAIIALLDAPKLNHEVYNVGPGISWTLLEWAQLFAAKRPGLVVRLAAPGETPTVDPHSASDRARLVNARILADTGMKFQFGLHESFAHLEAWIARHPDGWAGA